MPRCQQLPSPTAPQWRACCTTAMASSLRRRPVALNSSYNAAVLPHLGRSASFNVCGSVRESWVRAMYGVRATRQRWRRRGQKVRAILGGQGRPTSRQSTCSEHEQQFQGRACWLRVPPRTRARELRSLHAPQGCLPGLKVYESERAQMQAKLMYNRRQESRNMWPLHLWGQGGAAGFAFCQSCLP